jgi:hypothetical protein
MYSTRTIPVAENPVPETEVDQKSRKGQSKHQAPNAPAEPAPAARAGTLPRVKGVLRRTDVLGMQHSVGNRTAVENVRARGGTGLVSRTPGTPLVIQRASFSELMAFWKKQELGQETNVPTGPKPKGAPNLPPQVTTAATGETAALNPIIEEPKEAEKAAEGPEGDGGGSAHHYDKVDSLGAPQGGGGGAEHYDKPLSFVGGRGGSHYDPVVLSGGGGGGGGGAEHYAKPPSFGGGGGGVLNTPSGGGGVLMSTGDGRTDSSPISATESESGSVAPSGPVTGNLTKVKYLETEQARKEFQLEINGTIKQGDQPYDTSKMYSKFKGDGFGIYVMSKDGRFFSTSHKIGLFHHSSFLGGGDVAGAGEMQVIGGELKYLTNKSGHYWPGDRELAQTIDALKKAGTSGLGTATLAQLMPSGGMKDPYPGGPEKFLEDHPVSGGAYAGKEMNATHKGEDKDSVSLVKGIIRTFVPWAQQGGKLRKFPTPNADFGKKFDDIKDLVLKEFGWSDEDVVTYKEVLETWQSDAPITGLKGPVPQPVLSSSPITMNSSVTSKTVSSGAASPLAGSGSGRDWDAELAEIVSKGVNWAALGLSPYGPDFVVPLRNGGWSTPSAKTKVQLAKGEVTVQQLQGDS